MEFDGMVAEGEHLAQIAGNVVIKLPLTLDGLKACRHFTAKGIKTNVTLCFSANQALLAAKAGASYVSPIIGRLDDLNIDGTRASRAATINTASAASSPFLTKWSRKKPTCSGVG